MNKVILYLTLACFVLFSCDNMFPGYSKLDSGTYYKIHYLGEGEQLPVEGNHIQAHLVYRTMDDTLIFDTQSNYLEGLKMTKVNKENSKLTEALCLLREGDSATFILNQNYIEIDSFRIDLDKSIEKIRVDVKIKDIMSQQEYEKEQDRIKWLRDREMIEQVDLINYLSANEIDRKNYYEGIYYVQAKRGLGSFPKSGNTIMLQYKAYFSDGTLFDSTYEMKEPFTFTMGIPGQVIKGLNIGLRLMREGGKAKLILPSQLGFGDKGSSTGIVPPFTSLIYEVELIEIYNNEES
ncbi:MAG: FKBP-type peptidyl-prolyl cis-trans isomerase [Flavobacteriales bacterium]|nr:FKBP-type peptidyl-prolyl cis-trans isomerase [Flavobacteriales bacterium]